VVSKSPLTDRINDSLASSGFAVAGKSCGCDAIVIVGRAPELSVLIIDDGEIRLESAADCTGLSCEATDTQLRSRLAANFRIATSESWMDKQGQKQERTEWHRVVAWGKLAELCGDPPQLEVVHTREPV